MESDELAAVLGFGTLILIVAIIAGCINWLMDVECTARWEYAEPAVVASRYSFLTGCQVQLSDGSWIPEDNYRDWP